MKRITQYAVVASVLALALAPSLALAVTLPTVPPNTGGQEITGSSIVRIINDVVQIIVTISVIVAIGFFIWGAISYASGNADGGKEKMTNAAWGLFAMLAVGLLVNTIAGFINRGLNLG